MSQFWQCFRLRIIAAASLAESTARALESRNKFSPDDKFTEAAVWSECGDDCVFLGSAVSFNRGDIAASWQLLLLPWSVAISTGSDLMYEVCSIPSNGEVLFWFFGMLIGFIDVIVAVADVSSGSVLIVKLQIENRRCKCFVYKTSLKQKKIKIKKKPFKFQNLKNKTEAMMTTLVVSKKARDIYMMFKEV